MKAISLVAALFAAALAFDSVDAKTTVPVRRKVLDKSRRARIVSNTLGVARRYVNGKRVHDHVQVDAVGPITPSKLTDWSDELYTTPITLGTRQAFTVDLDTGSSDIWLRGPNCISLDGSCNKWNASLPVVNTDDSTLRSLGFKWSTQYGSGGVAGEVYSGPLQLGGAKVDLVDFGVSTSEEGFNSPGDGLLGMGFASISNIAAAGGKNTNFIDELGLGDDSQFAFYFSDASDGDYGELTIGGIDEAKFNGTMKYVPLNAETYWQFNAASATYTVGSTTGKLASTTKNAIADTGTTLLILDTAAANEINKAIGAGSYDASQGIYPISCSKIKGPPITITIDNIPLHITAQQYVMNVGANQCISGVTQGAASSGVQIWGDTFLRAVYTLFDKANNQLGFAQAVHPNLDEFEAEF